MVVKRILYSVLFLLLLCSNASGVYYFYSSGTAADAIDKNTDTGSSLADKLVNNWGFLELDTGLYVYPDNNTVGWSDTTKFPGSWTTGLDPDNGSSATIYLSEFDYPLPMFLNVGHALDGQNKWGGGGTGDQDTSPSNYQGYWDEDTLIFYVYDAAGWHNVSGSGVGNVKDIGTYPAGTTADGSATFAVQTTNTFLGYVAIGAMDRISLTSKLERSSAGLWTTATAADNWDFETGYVTQTNAKITNLTTGKITSTTNLIIQTSTDSTTGVQVLDADGGTPILNVDTTNERVGIGTASPSNALEVISPTDFSTLRLTDTKTDETAQRIAIVGQHWDDAQEPAGLLTAYIAETINDIAIGGGAAQVNAATNVRIYTAADPTTTTGTERFRVKGDGEVHILTGPLGIADTSPDAQLSVTNTSAQDSFRVHDASNDTSPFVIDASGNVGIGEASPEVPLHVVGGTAGTVPTLGGPEVAVFQRNPNTSMGSSIAILSGISGTSNIYFGDAEDIDRGVIRYSNNTDSFDFVTDAVTQMSVESDGGIEMRFLLGAAVGGTVVAATYDTTSKELSYDTSASAFKKNIRESIKDTAKIYNLVPKLYDRKNTGRIERGLIAEEVALIDPDYAVYITPASITPQIITQTGGEWADLYDSEDNETMIPISINRVEIQHDMLVQMKVLRNRINAQKTRMDALEARILTLESQ